MLKKLTLLNKNTDGKSIIKTSVLLWATKSCYVIKVSF